MQDSVLPFYDFFNRLRKEKGLELDTHQYYLFLRLFLSGYGWGDKGKLHRLLRHLWLSKAKYADAFDAMFEETFDRWITSEQPKSITTSVGQKPQNNEVKTSSPDSGIESPRIAPAEEPAKEKVPEPPPTLALAAPVNEMRTLYLEFSEDTSGREGAGESSSDSGSLLEHSFIFTDRFLPVRERRLQQIWRHVRFKADKIPGTELDLTATVMRIAREGGFVELAYAPRLEYRQAFHFLIDHGGSMVAFEDMAIQLVETFRESLPEAHVSSRYFHNHPGEYLFDDPYHTRAITVDAYLAQLRREPAALFIISDAGAMRGHMHVDRVRATWEFINKLQPHIVQLLWLNPAPRERWVGSSAAYTSVFANMVEISQVGLQGLSGQLKQGRS